LSSQDATSQQGSLCIVTELLARGSLEDVIRQGGLRTASYGLILNLALQVSNVVGWQHFSSCLPLLLPAAPPPRRGSQIVWG